ncbi:MAG: clostripain-related cysteine peptidase [Cyanobacteriota bacterium]
MNKNFKVFSALLVGVITISSCSTSNELIIENSNTSETLSNKLVSVPADPSILPQITSSKIADTEWGVNVKQLPSSKTQKKATILSYMGFNNSKGSDNRDELPRMINFHENSGSSSIMNMILQTDDSLDKDLKRYLVIPDNNDSKIVSPYTAFKNERDSSDYRVLQAFMRWGFSTYPSQIKILDIDSHGASFKGVVNDKKSGNLINLPNFAKSIKESEGKLDILNFDACLMGSLEVLYQFRDTSDVIIGSEDCTRLTGMLYTNSLPSILANSKNNDEVARKIVLASDRKGDKELYIRPNRKGKTPNVYTIAAFKAKNIGALATEMDNLSKLILSNISTQKQTIKLALDGTHALYIDEDDIGGERDLYEILSRIEFTTNNESIKAQIKVVRNALNKSIIIARINNDEKYAKGMAINISPAHIASDIYKATPFAKETSWDEMILAVNK